MLAAEENFCWYNDDEGVGRCGAEVESPARVEETCVPLLTSLTSLSLLSAIFCIVRLVL